MYEAQSRHVEASRTERTRETLNSTFTPTVSLNPLSDIIWMPMYLKALATLTSMK